MTSPRILKSRLIRKLEDYRRVARIVTEYHMLDVAPREIITGYEWVPRESDTPGRRSE